jgi:universal stress protein E
MRQHSLFASMVRTSTDWNLIRHCPYPLMLVSELDSIAGRPMLAAVDVHSGEENHDALNTVVLDRGKALGGVLGCELNIVNAWRATTPMMAVGSVDSTPLPTPADLHKEHQQGITELAGSYAVAAEAIHVEEGAAAYVITKTAESIGAGMIVMGTVARTGLSGALIGNTAESVLETAKCDVLVVKLKA